MPNPYEVLGRQNKALKLAAFIVRGSITADQVDGFTLDEWALAANGAGVKMPSAETRRMVIDLVIDSREGRLDRASGEEMGPGVADIPEITWDDVEGGI